MNHTEELQQIMENEMTDLRSLKKQQLIKINNHFGYIFKKKQTVRKKMIERLIPIHRKMVIYKKIISGNEECPICLDLLHKFNYVISECGHAFCTECIFKYITTEKEICPICREPYTYEDLVKPFTPKDIEFLLSIVIKYNQKIQIETEPETIEDSIQQPYLFIYLCKRILFKIMYLFMNGILLWKSIYFLCKMIEYLFENYEYVHNYRYIEL